MKINKETKTIEEITSYEAFDGTKFKTESECVKYESSAVATAKKAAWHYLVAERVDVDVFNSEDMGLYVFDVPDTTAYEIILHWGNISKIYRIEEFTPSYIGKRVAFCWYDWDGTYFCPMYATKEQMLKFYTEHIEQLFADKETE